MADGAKAGPALAVVASVLAGCTTAGFLGRGNSDPPVAVPREFQADGLAIYFETMRDLIEGDAVVKADVFMAAETAALYSPTTTNRLNYALALATPGHPKSNPEEAQKLLSALLAEQSLLPEERLLATIHLKDVEQRLMLDAEARRQQEEAQLAIAENAAQSAERLQATLEENRRLRSELEEAQRKLDAITNIERSIRERENGAN